MILPEPAGEPPAPHSLVVPAEAAGLRLDRWLAGMLAAFSRSRLQALIAAGNVRVDGQAARDAGHKLKAGQSVEITIPPPVPAQPIAQHIPLTILYEDDDLIVIDKPAGLVVHPAAGHEDGTLVNALIAHCGASLSGIGGVRRPGIVHRLDKDTSGLLVVAKNDQAHQGLSAQFADHGRTGPLERAYLALVWGVPRKPRGTIDAPIERSTRNREKMAIAREGHGRHAVTHYQVLESYPAGAADPLASLVRCELETGRTHQIRLHLAHIGHPLLGDAVYGAAFRTKAARLPDASQAALAALGRQALHATMLGFAHPATGQTLSFSVEAPADFAHMQELLAHL
ncbi:MAG: RluA family pseudouridine synthase [Bosea sp.]|jgi:23S rRNA pseudouridine1911/1915/1917 synthase|nr:RluA family pseudouridine synthase [Bosea sp. (in: a-proteobacteria)]